MTANDFDDEDTPLPPRMPSRRDQLFPTGRQAAFSRGALNPHDAPNATTRLWSLTGLADTTRMSAREIAQIIPLHPAEVNDPMATVKVAPADFGVPKRTRRLRWPSVDVIIGVAAFAAGLLAGAFIL